MTYNPLTNTRKILIWPLPMLIAWGWRNPHLVYINCSLRSQIGILWVVEAISRASLELKAACWGPNSFATADVWKMPGRHKTHQICLHASCTCDHFLNSTYFWSSDFCDWILTIPLLTYQCLTLWSVNLSFLNEYNPHLAQGRLKSVNCSQAWVTYTINLMENANSAGSLIISKME